jgi:hypothetical protein
MTNHAPYDCKPVILDPVTLTPLPDDSPAVQAMLEFWKTTTPDERVAFHEFTCHNSRDPNHVAIMDRLSKGVEEAIRRTQDQSFAA